MATIHNEILINAPVERMWGILANIEELEKYDPTVKKSTAISAATSGMGAMRKVDMTDGKNWFEEKVVAFRQCEALAFELTACSFPIHQLRHTYSFESANDQTRVTQVMEYQVKFGILGKLLDKLMIRKQTDAGVKKFLSGLKSYTEKK